MGILSYFRQKKQSSASVAKERLQVLVAYERSQRSQPDYLPQMQQEILAVIAKYVDVSPQDVQVNLDEDCSILELNVTLPEKS
ncbi:MULTISPECIES: cell division topological specificity factor MinE [Marinobacterium]|jgi:cell division topological specificity factor|uniref:Cell division topological specificity factor n=1 Tax=Marinobacterium iners DSM 11526 TaxID=1122198 RepID=A0A1H4GHB6_9GAMM|nr:cell division topological specificity factor MinE [Marinobacterium iners]QSR34845.1 cell division topological specificity factor MinE [Marinobacterium iners]SEB08400.1 cell division topological specificity factor MinE [Marinobacterium iners DSM 11526]